MKKQKSRGNLNGSVPLLPRRFQFMGLVLVLITLPLPYFIKPYITEGIYQSMQIVGMTFVAMARDKKEDEMTINIRFQAISWSFFFNIFNFIITPWMSKILGEEFDYSGFRIIIGLLLCYIMMHRLLLKRLKINEKRDQSRES